MKVGTRHLFSYLCKGSSQHRHCNEGNEKFTSLCESNPSLILIWMQSETNITTIFSRGRSVTTTTLNIVALQFFTLVERVGKYFGTKKSIKNLNAKAVKSVPFINNLEPYSVIKTIDQFFSQTVKKIFFFGYCQYIF